MNIELFHIYVEARARSTALKMKVSNSLIDVNYRHSKIWQLMKNRNSEMKMPSDLVPPIYRFRKSFRVNEPNREDGTSYHCPQIQYNKFLPLRKYASVFQSETTDFSVSSSKITENRFVIHPSYICADSQGTKSIKKCK